MKTSKVHTINDARYLQGAAWRIYQHMEWLRKMYSFYNGYEETPEVTAILADDYGLLKDFIDRHGSKG